jgi:hypothetical protein
MPDFPSDSNGGPIPGQTNIESDPQKLQDQANAGNAAFLEQQKFLNTDCQGWRGMSNGWHDREEGK